MPAEIALFTTRADNFGTLVRDMATGAVAAIDAPEAEPILAEAKARGWAITHVLVTHHHGDHVEGIPAIRAATGARVLANAADAHRVPLVDQAFAPGQTIGVGDLSALVIDTPGHTVGHVAFHFAADMALFAGDTLFSLGCGRLFEGTPAQMHASLTRLAALPEDTRLYCGHEYTASNARFALTVDPSNAALKARAAEVAALRGKGLATLPSTIGLERRTNPFLRVDDPAIAAGLGMVGADPVTVFAELRERKNRS